METLETQSSLFKETSNGDQDQSELQKRTSTVNLSLELRVMTKKAQFHHSLLGGKVTIERDGTQEAGVNLMSSSYHPTLGVHSTQTLSGRINKWLAKQCLNMIQKMTGTPTKCIGPLTTSHGCMMARK